MTTISVDLAKPGSEFTVYTIDGTSYRVGTSYYLASCDGCGWVGSSEECGASPDDDVICPKCYRTGADCGTIARGAEHVERVAEIKRRNR